MNFYKSKFKLGWLFAVMLVTLLAPRAFGIWDDPPPLPPPDADNDGLLDTWEWHWFGNYTMSSTNLDASGNTLGYDYTNGLDPNIIEFTIAVTNNWVGSSHPGLRLNVTAGTPGYYAVLVDSTNSATANWLTYTSTNISPNLGALQGWHTLRVGLKGVAPEATVTWVNKRLKLDTAPPVIVITNPVIVSGAAATVNVPMIQLKGYSPEELDHLFCTVSNALGLNTNLDAGVTDRYHDSVTWEFTTNYFECLDIELTNGVNVVTVQAEDMAGNLTVTNFSFTLDYSGKTNAPVVQITWPTNGTKVSGNSFNLDGFVNDPTVTILAQIVSTNGTTNTIAGLVERNGRYWVENLPLASGTNSLTLTVTDAVGNMTITNICVVQSTLTLAMNPVVPDSDLWKAKVNLTGTISDPNQAVWVNGVKGHNSGDGTWYANDVPTTSGGVASFTIIAYEPDEEQPDHTYGNP